MNKKYPVLVSLVIPAYNVENLIEMTLESVASQTLQSFECIIVNDLSTDNTLEVIKKFIKKDKRFKLVSHRANSGVNTARNTGLRFTKGKYIAFLDSDDLLMKDSLELRAKTLEQINDDSVIGTYAGSVTIDMNCKVAPEGKEVKLKPIDFITAGGNCPFNVNQPMFYRELFKKFGGFDQILTQSEDYEMWMRMLRYGYKIIPTNKQLVTYRQTEGSAVRDNPLLHLANSYQNFMACYEEYDDTKFTTKLPKHLKEPLSSYTAQLNIANRVLEFIGLGLAKGEELSLLQNKLEEYLPNYFDIIEAHRPFINRIKKGIDRYYKKNVDLSSPENKALNTKLNEIYTNWKASIKKEVPTNKKSILQNMISTESIVSNPGIQREVDLIFIPHKDYHVYTISLMKKYLEELNITYIVLDISMHYRDERAISACQKYDLPYVGYSNFILGDFRPKAFAVFNDWDPIIRSILLEAKKVGIATIGIVEGIQDYLDADTKQDRKAYQTVEHLFLPGEHDKKYFKNSKQNLYVGGIPRIFEMHQNQSTIKQKSNIALINSNFSYGVLEEHRDTWLSAAVEACKEVGYTPVISRHPADKGTFYPELTTSLSFYEALAESSVLISRFASGILEALAVGVLPIYFNPHGEKVDKFFDSLGAYPVANDKKSLIESLIISKGKRENYEKNYNSFLSTHCGTIDKDPSIFISTDIAKIIKNCNPVVKSHYEIFFNGLSEIDMMSGCFNNLQTVRKLNAGEIQRAIMNRTTEKPSVKYINELVRLGKFEEARLMLSTIPKNDLDNVLYKSIEDTINILQRSKG